MEKLDLKYPVIVEGKYDKIALDAIVSSPVIVLNGFSVFNNSEKKLLIKRLCAGGAILMTDSDKAGMFIRGKLKGYFADIRLYNVYIPQIEGKEKRKNKPSADGLLGVEGIDKKLLYSLLLPYAADTEKPAPKRIYTKADMYELGLSGKKDSKEKRDQTATRFGLPCGMTANALLEAINLLGLEI